MKKLLTLILDISMVMTTVPQTGMQVLAAETQMTEADTDKIEKIELVSGQNAFDYTYLGDTTYETGSGILYIKENAYAKTNKTYKS